MAQEEQLKVAPPESSIERVAPFVMASSPSANSTVGSLVQADARTSRHFMFTTTRKM